MMLKHMLNISPAIPLQISQSMNFPLALNEVKSHFQFFQNACRSNNSCYYWWRGTGEGHAVRFGVTLLHSHCDTHMTLLLWQYCLEDMCNQHFLSLQSYTGPFQCPKWKTKQGQELYASSHRLACLHSFTLVSAIMTTHSFKCFAYWLVWSICL